MENESSLEENEVWKTYECTGLRKKHPGHMVESASLHCISLPKNDYPIHESLSKQIKEGTLSNMQLECIQYACNQHQKKLLDGTRAGFFIGDSTGSGKGREIVGIIADNLARGRTKHVWLSSSRDLYYDALRDFENVGFNLNKFQLINSIDALTKKLKNDVLLDNAVVFCSYSELISENKKEDGTRMKQLLNWLGGSKGLAKFEGVLVLDECHRAKNSQLETKTNKFVIQIQDDLPNARVVYSSATGISTISNMAYLSRMGIWGPGTIFEDFKEFSKVVRSRDSIALMEIMTMQFKSQGSYVARNIGFQGVDFMTKKIQLTPLHAQIYRNCTMIWNEMEKSFIKACDLCKKTPENKPRKVKSEVKDWSDLKMLYWGQHQRFMSQLILYFKVQTLVDFVKESLAAGHCVVIGLETTGESYLQKHAATKQIISVCRSIITQLLMEHFPVVQSWELNDSDPTELIYLDKLTLNCECYSIAEKYDVYDRMYIESMQEFLLQDHDVPAYNSSNQVLECLEMRDLLLEQCNNIWMPPCALDEIIDKLGGISKVAEMTGRNIRQVREKGGDDFSIENKKSEHRNVMERQAFMDGKKLVSIISDAASTGVSLHADTECKNQRRRVHITLELPWSPDKSIQQLGRSHRSNQVIPPMFCLMDSGLAGENRFIASISKRLQSLGALTQGNRRASIGMMQFGEVQLDSYYGKTAVKKVFETLISGNLPQVLVWEDLVSASKEMFEMDFRAQPIIENGWCKQREVISSKEEMILVLKEALVYVGELGWLVEGVKIKEMEPNAKPQDELKTAKLTGKFDFGVRAIHGTVIQKRSEPTILYKHPITGQGELILHRISVDRGISVHQSIQELEYRLEVLNNTNVKRDDFPIRLDIEYEEFDRLYQDIDPEEARYYLSRHPSNARVRICLAIRIDSAEWKLIRPGTGLTGSSNYAASLLNTNYRRVQNWNEISKAWNDEYEWSFTIVVSVNSEQKP